MTKTKQVNFRVSPDELLRFKAIALSHGLEASEYFRAKFLNAEPGLTFSRSPTTEELQKRANAAEKIIALREKEKTTDHIRIKQLYFQNLISLRMSGIAKYATSRVELGQDASVKNDAILKMLIALENYIQGEF